MIAILVFPLIWLSITATITCGFYCLPSDVYVNGVLMSHEEFVILLWPKLLLGVFWLIGIIMLLCGLALMLIYRKSQVNRGFIDVETNNEEKASFEIMINSKRNDKYTDIVNQIENPDSVWDFNEK